MNWEKFSSKFEKSWHPHMKPLIESEITDKIYSNLKAIGKTEKILPSSTDTFKAFALCPYDKLKVVVLGLDPYPSTKDGVIVADGLAFSCGNTKKLQPSLEHWYNGIERDIFDGFNVNMTKNPDLSFLARQGVLLLNSALTVSEGKIGSHSELWEDFIVYLIKEVFNKYNSGLVYLLIGKQAQSFEGCINEKSSYIFSCEHPSAAARANRAWNHDAIFKVCNQTLMNNNGEIIFWSDCVDECPF